MTVPSKTKDFEIAIVGGGIAGLVLALALHNRGIPITVYERSAKFGEIGAGVSFTPNAVKAMKICYEGVYEGFERVCTRNMWSSKLQTYFDYVSSYEEGKVVDETIAFSTTTSLGQNAVHRAHFLDEMVKLVPPEKCIFNKHLINITQAPNGRQVMHFGDGTTAEADAIVGCDGIKSRVRATMYGADHPCVTPSFTNKIAYRGLVPMEKATEAIGAEFAQNAVMHLGKNGHILTFPVAHGKTMNIVAFHESDGNWEDTERLTKPGRREDALRDFAGWSDNVTKLLSMCEEELPIWAIFDTGANPVPSFVKGNVALMGDAAHATSPHHGAGAGFCVEDAAYLACLLQSPAVQTSEDLAAAFQAYNDARLDRGHWVVQSSRYLGKMYDWMSVEGNDMDKIATELRKRNAIIYDFDVEGGIAQSVAELEAKLDKSGKK